MPVFVGRVGTPEGEIREERITASTAALARTELERKGLEVFRVDRAGLASLLLPTAASFRPRRRIPKDLFLIFNQQFVSLLKAGLPVLQSFELLIERQAHPVMREVLNDIREQIRSGASLSEAFESHGELFPRLYATSLRAGERSGELEKVLRRFLSYEKTLQSLRRKVTGALVYPSVLMALSLVLVALMMTYVIPKFTEFYEGLGAQDLPLITVVVVATANFIRTRFVLIVVALVVGVVALRNAYRTEVGQRALDGFLLRLPIVGSILQRFAISQFARSLATLLAGGNPLVPALEISTGAIGNRRIAFRIGSIIQRVREGDPLWKSLEETGEMTPLTIEMIKVGEATGALEEMLTNVSEFYEEEIDQALARIVSLVEPAILVIMGGVIAGLLMSVYLPLFNLLGKIGEAGQ